MFGSSNPFGQSSGSSPFAAQSLVGQTSNSSSNNPFAPATQSGTSSPFVAQTGSSIFGSTSTGVFGLPQPSSPFGSTPTFGASSSPAFGSSTPTFGASPASSPFGGSSSFGQKPLGFSAPQSNPFGSTGQQSQSLFGQTSNSISNNPFAPSTQFGTSTGSSIFGSTSTVVFGAPQASSPFGSTPTFGASSSPAFGSSTSTFGASPASSPFGGSFAFGHKPLGFSAPQSNLFGSTGQQSQPAFGNSTFGSSTPFGATNTPAFGASSTPSFGTTSTPAFGASSTPAFGASNSPSFGVTSTPTFGASPTPTFGNTGFGSGGAFGASSTPAFGASCTPAFGASSTPAFGASSTTFFGASNTSSFSFGSSPAFGQSTSAFGSNTFGSTPSPFGGAQASIPTFGTSGFGQSPFGRQQGGSRAVPYAPTVEAETRSGQAAGKLESISAMPAYKDKSHEELRLEDYQRGDKAFGQSSGSSPFASQSLFCQTSNSSSNNPFAPATLFGTYTPFRAQMGSSIFGSTSTGVFGLPQPSSPFGFTPTFGASSSPAFGSSTPTFGASPASSPFGGSFAFGHKPLGFSAPQSNPFGSTGQKSQPALGNSTFGSSTPFGATNTPAFGASSTPSFGSDQNMKEKEKSSDSVPHVIEIQSDSETEVKDSPKKKRFGKRNVVSSDEEDDTSETKKQKKKHKYANDLRYQAAQHKRQAAKLTKEAIVLTEMADRCEGIKTKRVVHNQRGPSSFSGGVFNVYIEKAYVQYLRIRKSVALSDYMPRETTWLKINHPDGKRSWEVCYKVNTDTGSYLFCTGWVRLCKEYPVVFGDTCKFTFVGPNELRLVVSK